MNEKTMNYKRIDAVLGGIFALLTVLFLYVFLTNDTFFEWAFNRHHNVLSWYVRPVFILPIAFFAFKRSWAGVMGSVLCLFTSMFWFPAPESVSPAVTEFLNFEQAYLKGSWDAGKIFIQLSVPIFFIALIWAAWKHSIKALVATVVAAAVLKVLWSAVFAGSAGLSVVKPAALGLLICVGLIVYYQRKSKAK